MAPEVGDGFDQTEPLRRPCIRVKLLDDPSGVLPEGPPHLRSNGLGLGEMVERVHAKCSGERPGTERERARIALNRWQAMRPRAHEEATLDVAHDDLR